MTNAAQATPIPRALLAKREAVIAAATPPAPATNVVAHPSNPAAPDVSPAAAPAEALPELDMSAFIVADEPAAPAPAPAPAPVAVSADPNATPFDATPAAAPTNLDAAAQADIARLQGQVQAMQAMQAQPAQTHQQQAAQEAATKLLNLDVSDLTPEEQEAYAGSIPVINKIVNRALDASLNPVLSQLHARTVDPEVVSGLQTQMTSTAETGFRSSLAAAVPDLNALSQTPAFQEFLAKPVPYTGGNVTVRNMMQTAYKSKDVAAIRGMMDEYRTVSAADPNAVPPVAALHSPTASPAATPTPQPVQVKPMLAYSKRVAAGKQFQKGQITKAELDQIDAVYSEAFKENRVQMDK